MTGYVNLLNRIIKTERTGSREGFFQAFNQLFNIQTLVKKKKDTELSDDYSRLQASEHFFHMRTKLFSDSDYHKYISPYDSPYEAFINYMNVLSDFIDRLKK